MPLQNRVQPTGDILAHPARGLFMGNRGRIHTPARTLARRGWTTTAWLVCRLCFNNRHRRVWSPNTYTELFFLDEAVALAAGHRPCAECRRADYRRWQSAWQAAFAEPPTAPAMNARLHADRIIPATRTQRRHQAPAATLPPGTFILANETPCLVLANTLRPYTPAGYAKPLPLPPGEATVLTPRCTVAVLRAGYRPALHPSATTAEPR
jgi:hypothetical protein